MHWGAWFVAFVWIARSKRLKELSVVARLLVVLVCGFLLAWIGIAFGSWALRGHHGTDAKAPTLEPVAIYISCEWNHYPIKISAGSTLHVIRLYPPILSGNPTVSSLGIFDDIPAPTDKDRTWPSKSDGQWLSGPELMKVAGAQVLFKCELSSYGRVPVEDILIPMTVANAENKRRVYQVVFDPLSSGGRFPFSVVNWCPTEIYVTWPEFITVHVLGEPAKRRVPLKIIKRDWPADLMLFPPSAFKWTGVQQCNWDWQH